MNAAQTYYSARIDGKCWTKDAVPASFFESRGATVREPRTNDGDKDVFIDGFLVAKLFVTKMAAAAYVSGAKTRIAA